MTKLEIAQEACDQLHKTDTASLDRARKCTNLAGETIWQARKWPGSVSLRSIDASDEPDIILPWPIEHVIGYRFGVFEVVAARHEWVFAADPEKYERTGQPARFALLEPVAVHTLPSEASQLCLVSDHADDRDLTVSIRGSLEGEEFAERVTLAGESPIDTENEYDLPWQIAKPETQGNITVKDGEGNTLVTLWPEDTERKHQRITLLERPGTSQAALLLGKRRFPKLNNDYDTMPIANVDLAMIELTKHFMYEWARQYGKAKMAWDKAMALIASAWQVGTQQAQDSDEMILEDGFDTGSDMGRWGMRSKYG